MGWIYLKKSILLVVVSGFPVASIRNLSFGACSVPLDLELGSSDCLYRLRGSSYPMPRFVRLSCGPSLKLK